MMPNAQSDVRRLCLGTAKLGLPWYGAGSVSRPGPVDIEAILVRAHELGITRFDTGAAYGDAEDWLRWFVRPGEAVTKVSVTLWRRGAADLRLVDQAWGAVLMHNPTCADLGLPWVRDWLSDSSRVGVSVYTVDEAAAALVAGARRIQVPYCVTDRRHETFISLAHGAGAIVYARQPFLQGLLTNGVPPTLRGYGDLEMFMFRFDGWCERTGISRVEACLRVALDTGADCVVFGVGSVAHLEEVVAAARRPEPPDWAEWKAELFALAADVPPVVFPSLWGEERA